MKSFFIYILLSITVSLHAQQKTTGLTIEQIMRDPKWIGSSPANPFWSADGKLFFYWNPDKSVSDSLYFLIPGKTGITKADIPTRQSLITQDQLVFNTTNSAYTYSKDGDVFYVDIKSGIRKRITQTAENESDPFFSFADTKIVYERNLNLFAWDIRSGETLQLSNFRAGNPPASGKNEATTLQEKWLEEDQLKNFDVLKSRKYKKDLADSLQKKTRLQELKKIYTEDKILDRLQLSSDGRYITYCLTKPAGNAKKTIVPSYVTETGFTEEIPSRTKVGAPEGDQELFLYDRRKDTVYKIKTDSLPGIRHQPDFASPVPDPPVRKVNATDISWAPSAPYAVVDFRSTDNKDRWLILLDGNTARLSLLDHQYDSAWIDGPGIGGSWGGGNFGWISNEQFWFQSEKSGYSHLYIFSVSSHSLKAITAGNFEIQTARLSSDKKYFYFTSNELHPGEQHFYRLPVTGGKPDQLTTQTGANKVSVSPDEKKLAILYSSSNKPWELYLQDNKSGSLPQQITFKATSEEFSAYPWRVPELITFVARDGATVYARLYQPAKSHPSKPAVIFVHGAGYLQNAHKWWSSYFREYMFHNLLADNGYTVLDIDYRASSGYGRNWRTGIYRFMGGKDLTDNVDGAKLLVEKYGVNPKNIGIYGGSYGGFITLMAMFTTPGVFSAGAALRPVTDWAHYNHGYTSNILNEPFTDSVAYRRSSPIYHAAGLCGKLLICHGMIDTNVHFEDVVRLSQRLIELGKDNWEIAAYPLEDHGFVEPSSWTDEYKRIFRLFETTLKQ
ncbi:S9 family peptidase [Flavihumibacter profundi]|uniref:S9 family peptidase n=1 Tax=Flavihumibacter profundi TaxID=2716883 RepID=UPI001CC7FCBA|nr:prolyl oligopeptidase family serine peptidase [Flavihumibacter profundi]MBZ5857239.1 prolyl oligopeptidase family serine peptidase [Flavihumibacter profundi]